ncbi:MAG: hypothetical protein C4B59_17870, partial [Candidatus Methanogaster sp.]
HLFFNFTETQTYGIYVVLLVVTRSRDQYVKLVAGKLLFVSCLEKVLDEMKHHNPVCSFPTLVIDDKTCIVGYNEEKIREVLGK